VSPPENKLPENYQPICSDPNQIKYIRVAIHFLLPGKMIRIDNLTDCDAAQTPFNYVGDGNFTEIGDGIFGGGGSSYNGYMRAEDIIKQANSELDKNADQWRKANNPNVQNPPANVSYPATPPQIKVRYLLTGVYFHRDEDAYYIDVSERESVYQTYGVDKTNTLNVFYTPNGNWSGIANALGGSKKYVFNNDYLTYVKPGCRQWSTFYSGYLLNHEIGHTLSLAHTWSGFDNCEDTPEGFIYNKWTPSTMVCLQNQKANCWTFDPGIPTCPNSTSGKPCDEWSKISNNVMDYNEHPHAYTSCQIGLINTDLGGVGNLFVHSCNGCKPSQAFFAMNNKVLYCEGSPYWNKVRLKGWASFNENRWLIDICEVNSNDPNTCLGNSYNTGWNTGEVGDIDLASFYSFQPNKHYRVKLIVDNVDCPLSDEYQKIIEVAPCTEPGQPGPFIKIRALNPFSGELKMLYEVLEGGTVQLDLVNLMTGQLTPLMPPTQLPPGEYALEKFCAELPNGNYVIRASNGTALVNENVVKL
jgi:hypothetical protein